MSLLTSNLIFRSDAVQERGFSNQNLMAENMLPVGADQRTCERHRRWSMGKEPVSEETTWRRCLAECALL